MRTIFTSIKYDNKRDSYWTKVEIKSEKDSNKKTTLLFCASYEYLGEEVKLKNEDKITKWFKDDVLNELIKKGEIIFRKPYHLDVRALTIDGYNNGLTFLQNELTS